MFPVNRDQALRSIQPNVKVKFFSEDEILRIFDFVRSGVKARKTGYPKRYDLLFKVLLRTGARIEEIVPYDRPAQVDRKGRNHLSVHCSGLRPVDVNLSLNTISILTLKKKRREYRTLPLHPDLKDALMQYFLESHIDTKSEASLFSLRRQSVDEYLSRIESAVGFEVYAHKFRHTFAVKALLDGVPINVLQKWLAHSSLIMTSIYADILGMDTFDFMKNIR